MTERNENTGFGGSQLGAERVGDGRAGADQFGGDHLTAPQLSQDDMTGGRPGNQTGGDWDNRPPTAEDITPHLAGLQYPISKADLVQSMRWQKAPLPVIYRLEKLPEGEFGSEGEIQQAVEQLA